jgi:hypothetical protein
MLASHPYGALVLLGQLAYLLAGRARGALPWAAGVVVAALPLWYAYAVLAGRYGEGDAPKSTLDYVRESAGDLSSGYLPVLLGVLVLAAIGFARIRDRPVVAAALAGAVAALVLAALTSASPESRHLIFLLPFVSALVAAGLPARPWAILAVAVLVVFELAWAVDRTPELFEGEGASAKRARRDAAAWLARTARRDDVLHGYHPVFLAAWERNRSFPARVVPRADAELALRELEAAPPGRGVWVVEGPATGRGLDTSRFGPLTIVRSHDETGTPTGYLELAERVLSGIDLETVREAQLRYGRSSRSTASR